MSKTIKREASRQRTTTVHGLKLAGSAGLYRVVGAEHVCFIVVGTYRRGEPGRRTTERVWSVPGREHVTAYSLEAAVRKYQAGVARGVAGVVAWLLSLK